MKKVIILGGGISGITLAYLIKGNTNLEVMVIEKEHIGGLCSTYEMGGVFYEFGPHICYASEGTPSYDFLHELIPEFKPIKYYPKQSMDGEITDLATFPVTVENVLKLPEEDRVKAVEELYHVNLDKPVYDNFEKYVISRVGKTMYEYCYKNYNKKQWGIEPADMDSEWARFRNFYLRSGDYGMFGDLWQGHPGTYTPFFERLSKGINVIYDTIKGVKFSGGYIEKVIGTNREYEADLFVSTLPIDFLLNKSDELQYRGIMKLFYLIEGESGFPTYLCTFPNNYSWTRITDYVLQAEQKTENTIISFAIPHASTQKDLDVETKKCEAEAFIQNKLGKKILDHKVMNYNYVYPISSSSMINKYNKIIEEVATIKNSITFGRLGLYSYISMCTAIDQAYRVSSVIDDFENMNVGSRLEFYRKLREKLS